jgi:hypothetical protein
MRDWQEAVMVQAHPLVHPHIMYLYMLHRAQPHATFSSAWVSWVPSNIGSTLKSLSNPTQIWTLRRCPSDTWCMRH